jgi:hypothetical protein
MNYIQERNLMMQQRSLPADRQRAKPKAVNLDIGFSIPALLTSMALWLLLFGLPMLFETHLIGQG